MDREMLVDRLNRWFPVVAAVLSILLNIVSFAIGLSFSVLNLTFLGVIVIGGLAIISAVIVFTVAHSSLPVGTGGCQTLETTDELDIQDPAGIKATYRHVEKIKVLRDGLREHKLNLRVPQFGDNQSRLRPLSNGKGLPPYDVYPIRWGNGIAFLVTFRGATFRKGQIIERLGAEWELRRGYASHYEWISIEPDPSQRSCCLRVIFPPGVSPNSDHGTWYKTYPANIAWDESGEVPVRWDKAGRAYLEHTFRNLPAWVGTTCTLSWKWQPGPADSEHLGSIIR